VNKTYLLREILWSQDSPTQGAITLVLALALIAAATVYVPLMFRLVRLFLLERELRALADEITPSQPTALLDDFNALLVASTIQSSYEEFERRWSTAQLVEKLDRAPVRLIDIFDDRPLFPFGPRRSLLPVLPGLLLAAGAFAALFGLIPSLSEASRVGMTAEANSAWMAAQLGLALRAAAWGFICATGASLTGRLIEGAFEARSHGLDDVVEAAFGSISPGELAELTRRTQQSSLETLGRELGHFANELNERLDRGLQRIEKSTARSANLISQEQRGALHTIVGELSLTIRQGVEHHLSELRDALQRATEHQDTVSDGLAQTFQSMLENSKTQDRVARSLDASARSVESAAQVMHGSASEMQPVLEHLSTTSQALSQTADRIGDTQEIVARAAEGVRSALEHSATGVSDQREFLTLSLTEIRQAMAGLGDGLGESLQRSLHDIDESLSKAVNVFKETLAESNDTIDRLSSPIRATEGSAREIHLALDRVRSEIEVLGQWMNQASKPLRTGLADIDGRAEEIGRSMHEFNTHARQIDKTMESLRHEIHEESRRIQGAGSELGRRLQQNSDAMGRLESTTSNATRQFRPDSDTPRSRDRHWSPSPSSSSSNRDSTDRAGLILRPAHPLHPNEPTGQSPSSTMNKADWDSSFASQEFDARTESDHELGSESPQDPFPPSRDFDSDSAPPPTSRDFAGSGYRIGVAKAQGPDPYQRFDSGDDSPSNLRHFPTPERELGRDLKLSGLLGPRLDEKPDDLGDVIPEDAHDSDPPKPSRERDESPSGSDRD